MRRYCGAVWNGTALFSSILCMGNSEMVTWARVSVMAGFTVSYIVEYLRPEQPTAEYGNVKILSYINESRKVDVLSKNWNELFEKYDCC